MNESFIAERDLLLARVCATASKKEKSVKLAFSCSILTLYTVFVAGAGR